MNFSELLADFDGFKQGFRPTKLDALWEVQDEDGTGDLDRSECGRFLGIVSAALANGKTPTEE